MKSRVRSQSRDTVGHDGCESSTDALGMDRPISRRDFCNGVSLSLLAAGFGALPPLRAHSDPAIAPPGATYPPALTGLRGAHPGSFEVAHALAREGRSWDSPADAGEATYDLIVVGGGISGLSAAYFYRQRSGPTSRILVLDNHDDFGGHAKRNEFSPDARLIIGYGGSQSISAPSRYSPVAKQLLVDLGIQTEKFYRAFDRDFYTSRGLQDAIFFDRESYGVDHVAVGNRLHRYGPPIELDAGTAPYVDSLPIAADSKRQLLSILTNQPSQTVALEPAATARKFSRTSYNDYLRERFGANAEVIGLFQNRSCGIWGFGTDCLSVSEALELGLPGIPEPESHACESGKKNVDCEEDREPYIFHFPDGNASISRLLVRALIPEACPGNTMEDIVTARMDYSQLDTNRRPTRVRLNATAVQAKNAPLKDGTRGVAVTYVQNGRAVRVRARRAILACYNMIIPHLCPEIPPEQKEALAYGVKVPLVYVNVLIRNWKSFEKLGIYRASFPNGFYLGVTMDFPVSLGDYRFRDDPSEPTVLHLTHVPIFPGQGLSPREQHRMGHHALMSTSFADYERHLRTELSGLLGSVGFDAKRDILAITVNRWPHGYAYEYNELYDPEWEEGTAPHEIGRRAIGNISIANSDAGAYAYVNAAIDQADRAVSEILKSGAHGRDL